MEEEEEEEGLFKANAVNEEDPERDPALPQDSHSNPARVFFQELLYFARCPAFF